MKPLGIYIVGMPSGQVDEDGVDLLILIDCKLTAFAAEQVKRANPGSVIRKVFADKGSSSSISEAIPEDMHQK